MFLSLQPRRSECGRWVLCVHKVGGEFPFALHVYNSSESHTVSNTFNHLGCLLCHLGAERKRIRETFSVWFFAAMDPSGHNDRRRNVTSDLYLVQHSCAVHPAGHVNRVPPDIILRFMSSNHSCNHWTVVYSYMWTAARGEDIFKNIAFSAWNLNYNYASTRKNTSEKIKVYSSDF